MVVTNGATESQTIVGTTARRPLWSRCRSSARAPLRAPRRSTCARLPGGHCPS